MEWNWPSRLAQSSGSGSLMIVFARARLCQPVRVSCQLSTRNLKCLGQELGVQGCREHRGRQDVGIHWLAPADRSGRPKQAAAVGLGCPREWGEPGPGYSVPEKAMGVSSTSCCTCPYSYRAAGSSRLREAQSRSTVPSPTEQIHSPIAPDTWGPARQSGDDASDALVQKSFPIPEKLSVVGKETEAGGGEHCIGDMSPASRPSTTALNVLFHRGCLSRRMLVSERNRR